jgi:hypothetical protein
MAFKSVWIGERLERLIQEYPQRGQDPELAQELGVSWYAMRVQAAKLGLRSLVARERKSNNIREALKERSEARTDINWRYFDTWSNNMAWALGYTFADGCVTRLYLRYGCKLADVELLEIIQRELKSKCEIDTHYRKRATLDIGCVALVNRLQELHGVLPRKSYIDIPYPFVPDDFLGHFARGVLDGDGHIPLYKDNKRNTLRTGFQWSGTRLFITGLMEHLSFIADIPMAVVSPNGSIFRFQWSGRYDVIKLYHLIYPEGEYPYLKRKRDRIEEVLRNQGLLSSQ